MPLYELAALAAAFCWAFSGLLSRTASEKLGALGFNRIKQVAVFIMLGLYTTLIGTWGTLSPEQLWATVLSGFLGIFVGDTLLYLTLNRVGPRRTAILFSMNAPISVVLGWLFLGEVLSTTALLGILTALSGVVLAIVFGKRRDQLHQWEAVKGPLLVGVSLGVLSALSQAVGTLIARPVMASGADPFAVSAIRVGVAAAGLVVLTQLPFTLVKPASKLTPRLTIVSVASGFIGMGVGMTLLLFALSGGSVGIVSTLSATTPVILLPLLWIKTQEAPAIGAWIGAFLTIIGSALIFLS